MIFFGIGRCFTIDDRSARWKLRILDEIEEVRRKKVRFNVADTFCTSEQLLHHDGFYLFWAIFTPAWDFRVCFEAGFLKVGLCSEIRELFCFETIAQPCWQAES